jgi:hypothetical protein
VCVYSYDDFVVVVVGVFLGPKVRSIYRGDFVVVVVVVVVFFLHDSATYFVQLKIVLLTMGLQRTIAHLSKHTLSFSLFLSL